MRKRGQFYLIATIVIIAAIIGFATTTNYLKKNNVGAVDDLKEELEIESARVLDYGAINNKNMTELMDNFTRTFSDYTDKEIYFIVGGISNIEIYKYNEGLKKSINFASNGSKITTTIKGNNYEFDLKSGENFYFIIFQEIDGEKYVVRN